MDAFTVLFSTVKYIFVLYLENPKKAGDPWDYALVRGKKSANWACNWKHWIHQLWWVRLFRGWKWSPETLRVPCEKNPPGRDQHLQKLKEASMMQLLKGSLLGQGQTFCQGDGILISQTGNGHLIVSTGQSGLHLPLHQHPINPSLQERQRPHYHQDQGQQRPHCHQPGQRLQFTPWRLLRDLLLWVWHQVVHNQSALHDQNRRHVEWQLRQNFRHWTFSFWITIIIDAIKCLFLNFWGNQTV